MATVLQADWMSLIASTPSAEAQVQPTLHEAGWREAISLTVALWSFVALIYLPALVILLRQPKDESPDQTAVR